MPVMAPPLKATCSAAFSPCCRLGGAHVGAHRDVHADVAGGARQHRADREADGGQPAQAGDEDEQDHADDADGLYWRLR
jgi:hypothetical protein